MRFPQEAAAAKRKQHALTMVGRVLNVAAQEGKVKGLIGFMPTVWECSGRVQGFDLGSGNFHFRFEREEDVMAVEANGPYHYDQWMHLIERWSPNSQGPTLTNITFWVKVDGLTLRYWLVETLKDIGESIGEVIEVCLAETKVRVTMSCDQALDFAVELEYEEEVVAVRLRYEKLHGYCRICHKMTHDDKLCPMRVIRPDHDRGFNRRPDWEDRRDGKDRRHRNQGEERSWYPQPNNRGESSNAQAAGRGAVPTRQPLQRKLLPEFTAAAEARELQDRQAITEGRVSTKNWVRTAFGKAGRDGVVIDHWAMANFKPVNGEASQDNAMPMSVTVVAPQDEPSDTVLVHSGSSGIASSEERKKAEAATKVSAEQAEQTAAAAKEKRGLEKEGNSKRAESSGPIGPIVFSQPTITGLGPFSAPLTKSWYEETEEEEEMVKWAELGKGEGWFSALSGTTGFVCTGRDTQGNRLGIEEIISPLKELFEVPTVSGYPKYRGKKVKKFNEALYVVKKIVNVSAKKGKMFKKSRLTLKDYKAVAKPRLSKEDFDKGKETTGNDALVGVIPPVKN